MSSDNAGNLESVDLADRRDSTASVAAPSTSKAASTSSMSPPSSQRGQEPESSASQSTTVAPTTSPAKAKGSVAALMARFQSSPVASPSASGGPSRGKVESSLQSSPSRAPPSRSLSSSLATEQEVAAAIEDLPPMAASEGAVSLTDPDATIENPFRTSRTQTPEAEPQVFEAAQISTSEQTETQNAEAGPSQANHNPLSPSLNRFSFVSLTSTADRNEQSEDTSTGVTGSSQPETSASVNTIADAGGIDVDSELSHHGFSAGSSSTFQDRIRSRTEESDGKRLSTAGMEMLKENFERIHRQSKRHTRTTSEMTRTGAEAAPEVDQDVQEADTTIQTADSEAEADTTQHADNSDDVDWDFWGRVMNNYQEVAHENPRELSRAIQIGIPSQLRGLCWQLLSASKDPELELIYAWYIRQKTSPHEKQIKKDLNRTFPEQEYFKDGRVGQENLYNVVKAYSLYDEEVGYVQGMAFIVGPLLLNMPDEEAFSTLARLMKSYGLRSHFTPNMPGLQLRLFQFDRLLEDLLPLLHRHLTRQGVKTSHYATQWFMTLFSYRFPLEFVYRVLDSVFAEGIEAIFRFAVGLMSGAEEDLLKLNFEQALAYLKNTQIFDRYKSEAATGSEVETYDVDRFARQAYAVQIHSSSLDGYAAEFEESVKAATAHRRELEAARIVNRNLAAKVAELEDQLEKIQGEHVELVKDAVLSKVAKEETEEELIRYKMLYAELVLQTDQAGSNENMRLSQQSSLRSPSTRPSTGNASNGGLSV